MAGFQFHSWFVGVCSVTVVSSLTGWRPAAAALTAQESCMLGSCSRLVTVVDVVRVANVTAMEGGFLRTHK